MTLEKPQIITHITKTLPYTPYDCKWVPCSARFIVLGQHPRGTGALQVYELSEGEAKVVQQAEKPFALKCGTFGHSMLHQRHLATGDFNGGLASWDLERLEMPVFAVSKAHSDMINCIDGAGGVTAMNGPPEIVTGSRDGTVKIWDTRQRDKPVATIAPEKEGETKDIWAVAFGNSYDDTERVMAAGYENGDVKLFDLKAMKLLWETNVKNGVCGIEFDRKDIKMNKMAVSTLESSFNVFDLRTQHPKSGFAQVVEKTRDNSTVWCVKHSPQNRDLFVTSGGNGALNLYKYNYPSQRSRKGENEVPEGVAGTVQLLQSATVAEQPVSSFDWSPDKQGLCVFAAFDQAVRVGIVTRLNSV